MKVTTVLSNADKNVIIKAVKEKDAQAAGKIADTFRFKFGYTYKQVYEIVNSVQPVSLADWEELMQEADYYNY